MIRETKFNGIRISYLSFDFRFLSIHCMETIHWLQAAGCTVDLYVPSDVIIDYPIPLKCRIHRIKFYQSKNLMVRLSSFQAQLVETLWRDWRREGNPDFVYSRYSFMGMPSVILSRALHILYIAEVNGITGASSNLGIGYKRVMKQKVEKIGLKLANATVVPSMTLKNRIISQYGVSSSKLHVIPNGFNPNIFSPDNLRGREFRKRNGYIKSDFIVGFVGSLGEWQGLSIFKSVIGKIAARKDLANIKFLIAGDYTANSDHGKLQVGGGSGRRSIEHFIQNRNLWDKVNYLGHVSYATSADVMRACDLLVAPYSREYILRGGGAPMKLYAYLGCEKPVIISDLGDFTDAHALRRENAAILIPPESPDELVSAIYSLYRDPDLCSRMAVNGRQFAIQQRTWENSCQQILTLGRRIVSRYRRRQL